MPTRQAGTDVDCDARHVLTLSDASTYALARRSRPDGYWFRCLEAAHEDRYSLP